MLDPHSSSAPHQPLGGPNAFHSPLGNTNTMPTNPDAAAATSSSSSAPCNCFSDNGSKAVMYALNSLQDKIRKLELEREIYLRNNDLLKEQLELVKSKTEAVHNEQQIQATAVIQQFEMTIATLKGEKQTLQNQRDDLQAQVVLLRNQLEAQLKNKKEGQEEGQSSAADVDQSTSSEAADEVKRSRLVGEMQMKIAELSARLAEMESQKLMSEDRLAALTARVDNPSKHASIVEMEAKSKQLEATITDLIRLNSALYSQLTAITMAGASTAAPPAAAVDQPKASKRTRSGRRSCSATSRTRPTCSDGSFSSKPNRSSAKAMNVSAKEIANAVQSNTSLPAEAGGGNLCALARGYHDRMRAQSPTASYLHALRSSQPNDSVLEAAAAGTLSRPDIHQRLQQASLQQEIPFIAGSAPTNCHNVMGATQAGLSIRDAPATFREPSSAPLPFVPPPTTAALVSPSPPTPPTTMAMMMGQRGAQVCCHGHMAANNSYPPHMPPAAAPPPPLPATSAKQPSNGIIEMCLELEREYMALNEQYLWLLHNMRAIDTPNGPASANTSSAVDGSTSGTGGEPSQAAMGIPAEVLGAQLTSLIAQMSAKSEQLQKLREMSHLMSGDCSAVAGSPAAAPTTKPVLVPSNDKRIHSLQQPLQGHSNCHSHNSRHRRSISPSVAAALDRRVKALRLFTDLRRLGVPAMSSVQPRF